MDLNGQAAQRVVGKQGALAGFAALRARTMLVAPGEEKNKRRSQAWEEVPRAARAAEQSTASAQVHHLFWLFFCTAQEIQGSPFSCAPSLQLLCHKRTMQYM